jgi:putative two-component system response regulator
MRILLVDDNRTNLMFLSKLVSKIEGCEPVTFDDPAAVLAAMPMLDFDLAVVDYAMPGYNGVELLREINFFEKYRGKPYVMVTADTDLTTRMTCLDAGSIDFLTKPVNPLEFQARVRNLVALVDARNKLADKAEWLRQEVDKATAEIRAREEEIIDRLSIAASYKDSETGLHTKRVAAYSEAIAHAIGLPPEICSDIRLASPMHDIGKVGIRDAVLLKKGKLTEQEFSEMQRHTTIGCNILNESMSSLLRLAAEIAGSHHERWDGQGYPRRLSGEKIPLAGRIVAVADSFDALTTARPYKEAWSVEKAVEYIKQRAGTQFDPMCVASFIAALPVIELIRLDYSEKPTAAIAVHVA